MRFKIYLFLLFAACLAMGCEDLEDTYKDYAGDGAIRYLGRVTDVSVRPGWNRLFVKWTNSADPAIVNVKVQWVLNGIRKDTLLAKDATECNLKNLEDGNYEISVFGLDVNGGRSLALPEYARPYTYDHEVVRSFTQVVSKHAYIKDRLVLFFSEWQDNVDSVSLNYYTLEGLQTKKLTADFVKENKYYLLEDVIDPDKEVSIYRRGRVEGCEDLIVFDPYVLSHENFYTSDFKQWAKEKYGQQEISEEWMNSLTEYRFDYDLNSFEDLLYMPQLKTLVLGEGRYMNIGQQDTVCSKLMDMERSLFTLNVLHELNGLTVQRYGKHYFSKDVPAYVQEEGDGNIPPVVEFMDERDWTYQCLEEGHRTLGYLFDGNADSDWFPTMKSTEPGSYTIEVDMHDVKRISGVRVLQCSFRSTDQMSRSFMPNVIKIEYSLDKLSWKNATHVETNMLGVSNGEATYLDFKEATDAQYLRFTLYDQTYTQSSSQVARTFFGIKLAGLDVY